MENTQQAYIENPTAAQLIAIRKKINELKPQVELQELYTRLDIAFTQQQQAQDYRIGRHLQMQDLKKQREEAAKAKSESPVMKSDAFPAADTENPITNDTYDDSIGHRGINNDDPTGTGNAQYIERYSQNNTQSED